MDMSSVFASQSASHDQSDPAGALNSIRICRNKFEFNHLQSGMDIERRIRNIQAFAEEGAPALQQAWDCAIRASTPDGILNTALQYYASALDSHMDALIEAAGDIRLSPETFDRLTKRSLDLLTEMATWNALAYQPLEKKWAMQRLRILQIWFDRKMHSPTLSFARPTIVPTDSGKPDVSMLRYLAAQALRQFPSLAHAIVRSILIELCGAAAFTRVEIHHLVRVIRLLAPHVPIHGELRRAGYFGIDVSSGCARTFKVEEASRHVSGIAVSTDDIERALGFIRFNKVDWGDSLPEIDHESLYAKLLKHHWTAQAPERRNPRERISQPVNVHHGFKDVLQLIMKNGETGLNRSLSGQLIDMSATGCALIIPRWTAGSLFAPGRLIGLQGDALPGRQKFGSVVWMRETGNTPRMLQFSIEFFGCMPRYVTMRSEQPFPSRMQVENFIFLPPDDPDHDEKTGADARLMLPPGTYLPGRRLQDIHTGKVYALSNRLSLRQDHEICGAADIGN